MKTPSPAVLVGVVSALIHLIEHSSNGGLNVDFLAARQSLANDEIAEWIGDLSKSGLIPLPRHSDAKTLVESFVERGTP